ncbi:non-hydrolyzing UDP-N-acetylglucosamine 2-epimerase [Candidatus Nitrosocosmicus franklandus]|uniref:UDP-N-acetylglucosamine 2-epimerase homolog n=1 Tax=Candidatus Nitrosocosmicus franklandianus TaxID=1798806 RepID=A0A484I4C8_9ARCH|nr:UDP-N-acetylglucosamine 2-epimerase (non-hydrolyzing) [Candidatus Nitrosocosmicus franklandus]VFJ12515.1 UDP-N-acetylglucosamine 2-epimerase homolog [Candidatus Nitrosocosmicus franklandus]
MGRHSKIVSIVGARPNFVKLKPIHDILKDELSHEIIHTGQHYDYRLSDIFFKEFDLPEPDYNLDIGSGSPGYQVGEMIQKIERILIKNDYDLALVYGDTNSTFAGAFAAVNSKIKVAHVEAGLRSFDRRMPEEINRILTDNLSDFLFAPTNTATRNLHNERILGKIYETGDLSVELISIAKELATKSHITRDLNLDHKKYIVFTMHRAENTVFDESFLSIIKAFKSLSDIRIVFPLHPRTKKTLEQKNLYHQLENCKNVLIIPPTGYIDFISLVQNASKIITDSGGLQKEAYLLSVPCITIRRNTEWVETVETGWNVLTDTNAEKIIDHVKGWNPSKKNHSKILGNGDTAKVIKNIILNEILA